MVLLLIPRGLVLALALLVVAVALITARFLLAADRGRIEQDLRNRGDEPLEIRRVWFGGSGQGRCYLVRFQRADGEVREARCRTSLFGDLEFEDVPPEAQP